MVNNFDNQIIICHLFQEQMAEISCSQTVAFKLCFYLVCLYCISITVSLKS